MSGSPLIGWIQSLWLADGSQYDLPKREEYVWKEKDVYGEDVVSKDIIGYKREGKAIFGLYVMCIWLWCQHGVY